MALINHVEDRKKYEKDPFDRLLRIEGDLAEKNTVSSTLNYFACLNRDISILSVRDEVPRGNIVRRLNDGIILRNCQKGKGEKRFRYFIHRDGEVISYVTDSYGCPFIKTN